MKHLVRLAIILTYSTLWAQDALITNVLGRNRTSLNGNWHYIVDPYETGFLSYKSVQRAPNDPDAYWHEGIPYDKLDRREHGYVDEVVLKVPGDWNSQDPRLLYYEGPIWYQRKFNYQKKQTSNLCYLYFGAVYYKAEVFLNGVQLGTHRGGFSAFNLLIPDSLLKPTNNNLVVRVDNRRFKDEIPTVNTDWWNYGGITRDVFLVEVPSVYILDYTLQLQKNGLIGGVVQTNIQSSTPIQIEIPELKIKTTVEANKPFALRASGITKWSPEQPKRYEVKLRSQTDSIKEKIGFRTIEVQGASVLLNGKPIFMRGICIHEEIPQEARRATNWSDAQTLLGWAKELHCNMARLAHYPHNEYMTRTADSLGILIWSEIPVYWTIDFEDPKVLQKAKTQLRDMILRDKNRASIIIWSIGNETPISAARNQFMKQLAQYTKQLDSTRLRSAALEVHYEAPDWDTHYVQDPLGESLDIVSVNEYKGWYGGKPSDCKKMVWKIAYNKPFFISETGGEALGGFYADSLTRWSEEYQEWYYKGQTGMMRTIGSQFVGVSPWLLADFKSPKRNNPYYQKGWNNKGLIDQKGRKKKAFYVLRSYYDEIIKQGK